MRRRGGRWAAFALLLLAGAMRWIVVGAHPEAESTLASLTMGCVWAALIALGLLRRGPAPAMAQRSWQGLLAGAMLFAGPAMGPLLRAQALDATGLTMALALTPVAVGIAAAALGAEGAAGRIWPGLAAVGGLLLVLAEPSLHDPRTDLALLLAPVLTGVGAALFCARSSPTRWRIAMALLGGAAVFALALLVESLQTHTRPTVTLPALACDGVMALLGIYALAQVGATRWSAQFTLLPLLITVEGIVLVRPTLSARWVVGLALLALASVYLLLPPTGEMEPVVPKSEDKG